jgi:surface protein
MGVVNYKFNGVDASSVNKLTGKDRIVTSVKKSGRNIMIGFQVQIDTTLDSITWTTPATVGASDVSIDWGDGTITRETSNYPSHTYAIDGTYDVRFYGNTLSNYNFSGFSGSKVPVTAVLDWTDVVTSNLSSYPNLVDLPSTTQPFWTGETFFGFNPLLNGPVDHFDTSATGNSQRLFKDCVAFNQPINSWDTSSFTSFLETFRQNTSFNQPLNNWDFSSVVNLSSFFSSCILFNQDIGAWRFRDGQKSTGTTNGTTANKLVDTTANFIADGVSNGDYAKNTTTGKLATVTGVAATELTFATDDFTSGDGYRVFTGINATGLLTSASSFNNGGEVVTGLNGWTMRNVVNLSSAMRATPFNAPVGNWDVSANTNFSTTFLSCTAFNQDISNWDTSACTNFSNTFNGCTNFNNGLAPGATNTPGTGMDSWDTSRATTMFAMFQSASSFNQYLGSWDVSKVTTFEHCFKFMTNFQGNGLGNWDVSSSDSLDEMLFNCGNVNFAITHPNYWEIKPGADTNNCFLGTAMNGGQASGVSGRNCEFKFSTNPADSTSLKNLLSSIGPEFNQDISTDSVNGYWVMTRVVSIESLLRNNTSFNQDLSNWDVSNCVNFSSAFFSCASFANAGTGGVGVGLDSWDVSSGENFSNMFRSCPFPHTLESWNVSSATSMSAMFRQTASFPQTMFANWNVGNVKNFSYMFEGQISGYIPQVAAWNTSSGTTMQKMFAKKDSFGLDLSGWNTALVTDMSYMFESTAMSNGSSFANTVAGWSIASLNNATSMFNQTGPGTTNYDQILDSTTGWASQATIQSGVTFGAGSTQYTLGGNAEAGRNVLTGTYGWTITDGGGV